MNWRYVAINVCYGSLSPWRSIGYMHCDSFHSRSTIFPFIMVDLLMDCVRKTITMIDEIWYARDKIMLIQTYYNRRLQYLCFIFTTAINISVILILIQIRFFLSLSHSFSVIFYALEYRNHVCMICSHHLIHCLHFIKYFSINNLLNFSHFCSIFSLSIDSDLPNGSMQSRLSHH